MACYNAMGNLILSKNQNTLLWIKRIYLLYRRFRLKIQPFQGCWEKNAVVFPLPRISSGAILIWPLRGRRTFVRIKFAAIVGKEYAPAGRCALGETTYAQGEILKNEKKTQIEECWPRIDTNRHLPDLLEKIFNHRFRKLTQIFLPPRMRRRLTTKTLRHE